MPAQPRTQTVVLELLQSHPNRPYTTRQIARHVYGVADKAELLAVRTTIWRIRRLQGEPIETTKVGYKYVSNPVHTH